MNITEGGPNGTICVESTGDPADTLAVEIYVGLGLVGIGLGESEVIPVDLLKGLSAVVIVENGNTNNR